MKVVGRNGQALMDFFQSKRGAEAYLSTAYPGFPNYFSLFGPNLATGHTSVLYSEEMQVSTRHHYISIVSPSFDCRSD